MATGGRLCDICQIRDVTVFATDLCPECEQSLCEPCKLYHSASKLSKTHETIPFECFDKLPAVVKEKKNECPDHDARFEYYCSQHELPCCVECMKTTHLECRNLTAMHKVVEHFKTSNALSDFEQTLSDLLNNLNSLMKDRFDNISSLSDEKEKCLKEIADSKRNVIAHLDQLETQLKTEIEDLHQERFQAIEQTIKEFEVLKTNVAKMQEEAGVIKECASDFQLFIAFREFESTVNSLETDVQSLIKRDSARQISISFSPNVELAIETLLPSLGNVNVITKESNIRLVSHREKQAQILTIETPCIDKMPCIDKIQLTPVFESVQLQSGKDKKFIICDSCFLENGRLVFSDKWNKRLIVFKDNGLYEKGISLPFMPNAVANIKDNRIAVSDCNCNKISMISIERSLVDNSFEVDGIICSLSFTKGHFLILVNGKGCYITDNDGNILNKIHYRVSDLIYAVLLNDKTYYSQWKEDRVVCYDLNGINIHEYKDINLKAPLGVSCSDKNVLFITGFKSNNIYALASNGNELKELYCNSNLSRPRAISYNDSKQQLLVSTEDGKVFLFDVIY